MFPFLSTPTLYSPVFNLLTPASPRLRARLLSLSRSFQLGNAKEKSAG